MNTYTVQRTPAAPPLTGQVADTPWADAATLAIDTYPWYTAGGKQATTVRLLHDDEAIYVQFQCEDRHIFCEVTELNGPVSKDSCVELFATIDPDRRPHYLNFEANCCGTFLMGFNGSRAEQRRISPELARRVAVVTSIQQPTRDESPDDDGWWLTAKLPLEVLSQLAGQPVQPTAGTRWRANFYRCGGRTERQYACWNPIDTAKHPRPDFHRPEFFGQLLFE